MEDPDSAIDISSPPPTPPVLKQSRDGTSSASAGVVGIQKLDTTPYLPCGENRARHGSTSPVFVVGCPRSGTTFLYHMILSSGGFALFPFESDAFALLGAKFPDLASVKSRRKLVEYWLRSENFARSSLERSDIEPRILRDCRSIGDFLCIVMEALCRKQNVPRWAEKTPDHVLYIPQIKRSIPKALIVHIIRDGRDVALSLAKFRRIRPYFWQHRSELLSFGMFWQWMVRKGRADGQKFGRDYCELHYEDLVARPRETLGQLGRFIGHDLNYDRILRAGIGSVSKPETSFENLGSTDDFNPVGRWKKQFSVEDLATFEALVGGGLEEAGYPLATPAHQRRRTASTLLTAAFHISQLRSKLWLKSSMPLGRFVGRRRMGR